MSGKFSEAIKKVLISSMVFVSLTGFVRASFAAQDHNISVRVNGIAIVMQEGKAYVDSALDTTYVPLRFVSEALNAEVNWNSKTQTAGVTSPDNAKVSVSVGSKTMYVNGKKVVLNAPAKLVKTAGYKYPRTMVPLRAISDGLGATVNWDKAANRVDITTPWKTTPPKDNGGTVTPGTTAATPGVADTWIMDPVQKKVAPIVFRGIDYNTSTGQLRINIPEIPGKTLKAWLITDPGTPADKSTKIIAGQELNVKTNKSFYINLFVLNSDDMTDVYDSYSIYTYDQAVKNSSLPLSKTDLTVFDSGTGVVPLQVVYDALGIK